MYQVAITYNARQQVVPGEGLDPVTVTQVVQAAGALYPADDTPEAFLAEMGKTLAARGTSWADVMTLAVQRVPTL